MSISKQQKRQKKRKKTTFLPILIFELALVCILSAATCSSDIAADIAENITDTTPATTISQQESSNSDETPEGQTPIDNGSDSESPENQDTENTENQDTENSTEQGDITDSENPDTNTEHTEHKDEMRAVWISYIEFSSKLEALGEDGFSKQDFQDYIDEMFDNCLKWNMNTVIVHVRPYGDAMYPSKYFPYSAYISGKQGKDPGFDPLDYMVEAAHSRGLKFEAWLNPYRVATGTVKASSLSKDNQARKWMKSSNADTRRNVLAFGGNLYYNPAKKEVRELIANGVKEIVENYDIDGIHFDDYFYPSLGSKAKPSAKVSKANYKDYFDYKEYISYSKNNDDALSLVKWRRDNVNKLVKSVYSIIKDTNPNVVFGISPAGNISNLLSKTSYFVDIKTWLSNDGYVDYICPQIYWTFDNGDDSFDIVTQEWLSYLENENIKLYIGIPVYKAAAGKNSVWDWKQWNGKTTILKKQINYCRDIDEIDGFCFFSYQDFIRKAKKKEIKNLLSVLD